VSKFDEDRTMKYGGVELLARWCEEVVDRNKISLRNERSICWLLSSVKTEEFGVWPTFLACK